MKRHLQYWRNSLADAARLSPQDKDVESAREDQHTASLDEVREGQLSEELTTKLLKHAKVRILSDADRDDELTVIPAYIFPIALNRFHTHGEREQNRGSRFCLPLCIPATLRQDGKLFPDDLRGPILSRNWLEPAEHSQTIGQLEEADRFYTNHPESPTNWQDTIAYADELMKTVSGQSLDRFCLRGWNRLDHGLVIISGKFGPPKSIIDAYDDMLADDHVPPLIGRLIEGIADEGQCGQQEIFARQKAHLGQMTDEFGLAPSQREALAHALRSLDQPNEIVAINGPPGTGKTALLQSIVATLWVKAALDDADCPLIATASSNNQAVTNVIDSFLEPIRIPGKPLSGRWIDGVKGHGLYLPSAEAKKNLDRSKYHVFTETHDHFAVELETIEKLDDNRTGFLNRAKEAFGDETIDDLAAAKAILHKRLRAKIDELAILSDRVAWLHRETPGDSWSFAACRSRSLGLEEDAQKAAETLRAAEAAHKELRTVEGGWDRHKSSDPFWMVFSFLPSVRRRRQRRDKDFIRKREQQFDLGWLHGTRSRGEIDDALAKALEGSEKLCHASREKSRSATASAQHYRESIDALLSAAKSNRPDLKVDDIFERLDRDYRYEAFQLATHYWEARYLIEVEQDRLNAYVDNKAPNKRARQYRRLAKLTPCFVSTAYMLPKHFTGWFGSERKPMWTELDLLIIDEAGQTGTEIVTASFAYAKRAVVVGDIHQIEPIHQVPESLNRANVKKFGLDDRPYDEFAESGLSAAEGSLMLAAQQASRHTMIPELARGLFLREHRRCRPEIIVYCNALSYRGVLRSCRKDLKPSPLPPMGYAHILSDDRKMGSSRGNAVEAKTIALWLAAQRKDLENFYKKNIGDIVGIVTPFSAQTRLIRQEFRQQGLPIRSDRRTSKIVVGTVHSLQGAEREIVIFSPTYGTRHHGQTFFGQNKSMLNVAVSRAKDSFLVFGNMHLFGKGAIGEAPRLLGRHLFHPDHEITDIQPVFATRDGGAERHSGKYILSLNGHREVIKEVFRDAERQVAIVSPYLSRKAIVSDNIAAQIRAAASRDIAVKIFTDASLHRNKQEFETCLTIMREAGALIYLAKKQSIHSKLLWRDRDMFVLGSFNWLSAVRQAGHPLQRHETSAVHYHPKSEAMIKWITKDLEDKCELAIQRGDDTAS